MSERQHTLSASQVSDAITCETKWALRQLLPKQEGNESAKLGSAVHTLQERYLTVGTRQDVLPPECNQTDADQIKFWRKAGHMALAGMPFMPGPGTGGVEGHFTATLGGIRYQGFLDWQGRAGVLPGADASDLPAAFDHKTSSDPSKYGLWGKDAFLSDPQALIYGAKLLVQHRADAVFLRWVYYWSRVKSRALPSDVVLTRAEVEDAFGAVVHPTAYRQVTLAARMPRRLAGHDVDTAIAHDSLADTHEVRWANSETTRNANNCQKYGGCEFRPIDAGELEELAKKDRTPGPYRGLCKLSESERARACMSGLNEAKVVSVDRLSRKTKNEGEQIMSGAPDLFAKLNAAAGSKPSAAPPAPGGALPSVDLAAALKAGGAKTAPKAADPVNPPEKPAVSLPAQGADLQAHLKAKGAPEHVRTESKPLDTPKAPAKRASVRPPAATAPAQMPAPASVEQSVAKLDSAIADSAAGSNYRDGMAAGFAARLAGNLALDPDEIATRAYAIADAMMRERAG